GEVLAIARDVDEVVVVYEDPVLPSGPLAAVLLTAPLLQEPGVGGAAPRLKEVALFVELEDRRRGYAAARVLPVGPGMAEGAHRITVGVRAHRSERAGLVGVQRTGTMIDPDVVVLIDEQTADLPEPPVVRQGLRPTGIDGERRCARRLRNVRSGSLRQARNGPCLQQGVCGAIRACLAGGGGGATRGPEPG